MWNNRRVYDGCRRAGQISLTSAVPTQIVRDEKTGRFTLANPDATNYMYIGTDNTVSSASGFPLKPGTSQTFDLVPSQDIWVVQSSGGGLKIGILEF